MKNIILFGPPGSGKGTQSEFLIKNFNLIHLSTGNILREEVVNNTELGREAKRIMDEGKLVSDEIVIGMIKSKIEEHKNANGFIFDGFPRTTTQAEALDKMMTESGLSISTMLSLDVPQSELLERLLKRGAIEGRSDDNEATITNRIHEYHYKTAPVGDYYNKQGKLEKIEGTGTIEEISNRIKEALNKH